jgi:hypothetical protein
MRKQGHIFGYRDAMAFIPDRSSAIIRICDFETRDYCDARGEWDNSPEAPLVASNHWKRVFSYRFGDIDPDRHVLYEGEESAKTYLAGLEDRIINPDLAKTVVQEFASIPDNVQCYVFHCNAGSSRSPAVAIALNRIFNLDLAWGERATRVIKRLNSRNWEKHHPGDVVGNLTVYNRLMEAAKELGFLTAD